MWNWISNLSLSLYLYCYFSYLYVYKDFHFVDVIKINPEIVQYTDVDENGAKK